MNTAEKGTWDLVAVPKSMPGEPVLLVQVKCNRWPESKEVRKLVAEAIDYKGTAECQVWKRVDGNRAQPPMWILREVTREWGSAGDVRIEDMAKNV
jgi:hypothetical protein